MRNLKKILALVVVFALAISMMANAVSFTDVPGGKTGDTNKVNFVSQLGIIKGYASADGKTFAFKPDANITRAEMATIIYRTLTADVANANFKAKTNFPDISENDWFGGYVKYATALEPSVILGRTDGKFDPQANVRVDEAATMLVRALGYTNMSSLEAGVAKACELGILTTAAGADAPATRGQVADMVYNAMFNEYKRNASKGVFGQDVAPTLAYAIFKITPFDAVITASADGNVNLSVISAFDGFNFSNDFYAWLIGGEYDDFLGSPYFEVIGAKYPGFDAYVGYSVRIFTKDLNGNQKLDVYDGLSFMYVSPKNVVLTGDQTKFDSQSGSPDRVANSKFAFSGGKEPAAYAYENTAYVDEPIGVYENGRLVASSWNAFDAGFAAYANPGMSVEAYFEKFMNSAAYSTYKMIDNDNDGRFEFAYTTYTGVAQLGDTTSTGFVYFGNIDNTNEKTVDWTRVSPKFTDYFDNTIDIKASDVTFGNAVPGNYVYITPNWAGDHYTYTLEKATTATGKLTAVGFGGQGSIQLDGKSYAMANTLFLYNYPGYIEDYVIDGDHSGATDFYGLNNKTNLGKYFQIVLTKTGAVWRVEKYTPASSTTKGKYGIITDVANTPVNLKASDPFAAPEWVVQVKMTNENGENKVYNTNIPVTQATYETPAAADQTLYGYLTAAKGKEFLKYALDSNGKLVVDANFTKKLDHSQYDQTNNIYGWTNAMTNLDVVFDYTAATKYFVKDGFSTVNGDLKYKVDEYTTIFSFTDKNGNNLKDADEAATVIKAADLADQNNVTVYADDTFIYSAGIDYVYAIVLMNKSTTAVTTHIGWWQTTQAKTYDSDGNETSWTYKFAEHNGDKTYVSEEYFAGPWVYGASTWRLFMYDVDEDGNIVKFYDFVDRVQNPDTSYTYINDFVRNPIDLTEGQYFTVQLGTSAKVDANTMDLNLFINVKNPVLAGQEMTIMSNAQITDDTKIFILKTAGHALTEDSWYKANSSITDPFFDFNKWTGNFAGTPYDLTAAEKAAFNQNGDYYQFGWAKFAIENGQLTIVELYLTEETLGASLPQ